MTHFQMSFQDALQRHFTLVSPESLRELLLNILEYQPQYLTPIPSGARERFKMLLTQTGRRIFAQAFAGRYQGKAREELEADYEAAIGRLRRELHSAITDWDRLQQRQGQTSQLVRTYPQHQLLRALQKPLRDIHAMGLKEGYLARMQRLGGEVAMGVSPASAEALLQSEVPAELEGLLVEATTR